MSYFYTTVKISVFIWLQLTGIFSTQQIHMENDITTHLNAWVSTIFAIDGINALDIICDELKGYNFKVFGKYFLTIYIMVSQTPTRNTALQMVWNFKENNTIAFFEKLDLVIWRLPMGGPARKSDAEIYPTYNNFTISADVGPYTEDDLKINCNITYSSMDNWSDIPWNRIGLPVEDGEGDRLEEEIRRDLPTILQEGLNYNENFTNKLYQVFQEAYEKPRKEIISTYPDFSGNSQKYYYHIPQIPLFCFTLKRIVISGLTNFESYGVVRDTYGNFTFTHSLLIRNVQGTMILDYGFENEPNLDLHFQIDRFILSKNEKIDCIRGQAEYYKVTRTKANVVLSDRHSELGRHVILNVKLAKLKLQLHLTGERLKKCTAIGFHLVNQVDDEL
ncbi:uncharacterized protein LOC135843127 isoform X2 [Planococcus citri]|uniref:uncharacterized protein LOC135843127 isoform X2 n=1 Tax=Planococcus citri TaxID=170843 RepID=UPI0031F984E7